MQSLDILNKKLLAFKPKPPLPCTDSYSRLEGNRATDRRVLTTWIKRSIRISGARNGTDLGQGSALALHQRRPMHVLPEPPWAGEYLEGPPEVGVGKGTPTGEQGCLRCPFPGIPPFPRGGDSALCPGALLCLRGNILAPSPPFFFFPPLSFKWIFALTSITRRL